MILKAVDNSTSDSYSGKHYIFGIIFLLSGFFFFPFASGAAVRGMPGMGDLPWINVDDESEGVWVRYRVGSTIVDETSFMTLALVGTEEGGGSWIEIRLSRTPSSGFADFTMLTLTSGAGAGMDTERMLIRMGGGEVFEADMNTMPGYDSQEKSPFQRAGACVRPDSDDCAAAASEGVDIRRFPVATRITAAGSMAVEELEIIMEDGTRLRFGVSESVPITGLVSASNPDGSRLEIDGMGTGARQTVSFDAKLVSYDELGEHMTSGLAATKGLQQIGRPVNPDERDDRRRKPAQVATDNKAAGNDGDCDVRDNSGVEEKK